MFFINNTAIEKNQYYKIGTVILEFLGHRLNSITWNKINIYFSNGID